MKNSCLLSKFVKKGTFLDAYINKNKGYITPYVYDFWNGMHLLSTIAGCKSYFESTYNVFRLNLYIMYLNDSNFDLHHDAVRAVYDEKSDDELINSPTSVESMITLLTSLSENKLQNRTLYSPSTNTASFGHIVFSACGGNFSPYVNILRTLLK